MLLLLSIYFSSCKILRFAQDDSKFVQNGKAYVILRALARRIFLNVEILYVLRISLDKLTAGFNLITHECCESHIQL